MMEMKKGQVSIFVVIRIILIVIISVFFLVNKNYFNKNKIKVSKIERFVRGCIGKESVDIIYEIGRKGGYYFSPEQKTDSEIPIYYLNGEINMPSKEDIEEEISNYLEEKLFFCVGNFEDFPDFEVGQGEIDVETKIKDEEVELKVNYPLSVSKGESNFLIEDFKIEIPVRFGVVYKAVSEIAESLKYEGGVCLNCILKIMLDYDLYINTLDYDSETIVFFVRDENSKIEGKPFRFVFAGGVDYG